MKTLKLLFCTAVTNAAMERCGKDAGSGDGSGDSGSGEGSGVDLGKNELFYEIMLSDDQKSGNVTFEGYDGDCEVQVKTTCQNVAYAFEQFDINGDSPDCLDDSIRVKSDVYDSTELCQPNDALYEWTKLGADHFSISSFILNDATLRVKFQCVEDLLGCASSPSDYGEIFYQASKHTFVVGRSYNKIEVDGDASECATKCWNTAGCSTFMHSEAEGCAILMGKASQISQLTDGVSSGQLSDSCPVGFDAQFEIESHFYAMFTTTVDSVDAFLAALGEEAAFDTWGFKTDGDTTYSMFTGISEETPADAETESGEQDGDNFSYWVKYETQMLFRFPSTGESESSSRKRRSANAALEAALAIATSNAIDPSAMPLPDGTVVAQVTEPVQAVQVLSNSGESSGNCDENGCTCNEGFEKNADGNCVAPEGDLPTLNECDYSAYPAKADLEIADYVQQECRPDGYTISVDRCAMELFGFNVDDVSLKGTDKGYDGPLQTDADNSCTGESVSGSFTFNVMGMNACGTERTANQTHVTISNALSGIIGDVNTIITRQRETYISFSCVFKTAIEVSMFDPDSLSTVIKPVRKLEEHDLAGIQAAFEFAVAVYTDLTYTQLLPQDHVFNVPEKVFVGFTTSAPIERYHLAVKSCYFTRNAQSSDEVAHQIIQDGCPTPEEIEFLDVFENHESSEARFSFESFIFHEDEAESTMFLHCRVKLCDHLLEACEKTCEEPDSRRRKRSVELDTELVLPLNIGRTKKERPVMSRMQRIMSRFRNMRIFG